MRLLIQLATLLFAAGLAYVSLQPAGTMPGPAHIDKVQHALAYGVLSALIAMGWPKLRLFGVVMMATIFGIGIEIAQGLGGQGRMLSGLDALANAFGASLSAFIIHFFRKRG